MVNISINDKTYQIEPDSSLHNVLENNHLVSPGIAVAVNENIISRADWEQTVIKLNDQILIIKATQGG
ncbi:MAG: sulfur carrier protein ThiS [Bacteroidota bacterium]